MNYKLYTDGGINDSGIYFSFRLYTGSGREVVWVKEQQVKDWLQNPPIHLDSFYSEDLLETPQTTNVAEYAALFFALHCRKVNADIYSDSQLMINQLKGEWSCDEWYLKLWRDRVKTLLGGRDTLNWVKRGKIVRRLGH